MKTPATRSPIAKDLASPKYHQRVVPGKKMPRGTKRAEEDIVWRAHADWKKREGIE